MWFAWFVVVVVVTVATVFFVALTEGRYFGKPIVKWIYDRFGSAMFGAADDETEWQRLLTALHLSGTEHLLDVGTAVGGFPLTVASLEGFAGEVVGIDWSEHMIRQASEAAHRRGVGAHTRFLVSDLRERLPFSDSSFDVVVCLGVLEGLPDSERALRELARVLKPGGKLVVSLYRELPGWMGRLGLDWYVERLPGYGPQVAAFRRTHDALLLCKPG